MIDSLTIESEGTWAFTIKADGQDFLLLRDDDGGSWHLSWEAGGRRAWVGGGKIKWTDALARALVQVEKHLRA